MAQSKLSPKKAEIALRRQKALEMRAAGATFENVAQGLAYSSPSAARRDIEAAFKQAVDVPVKEAVGEELNRCDRLIMALWKEARAGDVHKIDRIIKLMELRGKYLGLFQPERFKHDITVDNPADIAKSIVEIAEALAKQSE